MTGVNGQSRVSGVRSVCPTVWGAVRWVTWAGSGGRASSKVGAMATMAQWVQGARVRTLPNSIAPVLVGAGAAAAIDRFHLGLSVLAMIVSVSLQVGVNYANDYSDGIRGTDTRRVGPLRLVGAGLVKPA